MKFKELEIQNFKGIEAMCFTPNNITTVVLGPNGRGKTSFKQAIYACISGNFPDNAIMKGKDFCRVGMTLPDGSSFSRTQYVSKPSEVRVNGKKVTAKSLNEFLAKELGLDVKTFSVISSAEVIESLSSADLGTLMLSAIPEKLNKKKIKAYAGAIPTEVEEILLELFPDGDFEMSCINTAYSGAFETRKFYKKMAANYKAKIDTYYGEDPELDQEDIKKRLADITVKEAQAAEAKKVLSIYEQSKRDAQKVLDRIAEIKKILKTSTAVRATQTMLDTANDEVLKTKKELAELQADIRLINSNIDAFEKSASVLQANKCPLDEKIVCSTDKSAMIKDLQNKIAENKKRLGEKESAVKKAEENLEKLQKKADTIKSNKAAYDRQISLQTELDNLEKMKIKIPEKPDISYEDFSDEKRDLERKLKDCEEWSKHLVDVAGFEENTRIADTYTAVCKLTEPKGTIINSIMDYYLTVFQTAFNERAKELKSEYEIKFEAIDGVQYQIKTDSSGIFKPFSTLSSGEKGVTSFLLLDMFNQLSKQKLMLIDDIDKLDADIIRKMMELIMTPAMQSSYDNIILMGVNHEDTDAIMKSYPNVDLI